MSAKLIRGANGKIYEELKNPVTLETDYVEVKETQGITEIAGQLVNVRDSRELSRQKQDSSHHEFLRTSSPQNDRQRMRRAKLLEKMVEDSVLARPTDIHGPDIRHINDDEFMRIKDDPEFMSLAKYAHKLTTPSGRTVRPILSGELGMIGTTIYVLEGGVKMSASGIIVK